VLSELAPAVRALGDVATSSDHEAAGGRAAPAEFLPAPRFIFATLPSLLGGGGGEAAHAAGAHASFSPLGAPAAGASVASSPRRLPPLRNYGGGEEGYGTPRAGGEGEGGGAAAPAAAQGTTLRLQLSHHSGAPSPAGGAVAGETPNAAGSGSSFGLHPSLAAPARSGNKPLLGRLVAGKAGGGSGSGSGGAPSPAGAGGGGMLQLGTVAPLSSRYSDPRPSGRGAFDGSVAPQEVEELLVGDAQGDARGGGGGGGGEEWGGDAGAATPSLPAAALGAQARLQLPPRAARLGGGAGAPLLFPGAGDPLPQLPPPPSLAARPLPQAGWPAPAPAPAPPFFPLGGGDPAPAPAPAPPYSPLGGGGTHAAQEEAPAPVGSSVPAEKTAPAPAPAPAPPFSPLGGGGTHAAQEEAPAPVGSSVPAEKTAPEGARAAAPAAASTALRSGEPEAPLAAAGAAAEAAAATPPALPGEVAPPAAAVEPAPPPVPAAEAAAPAALRAEDVPPAHRQVPAAHCEPESVVFRV
jgi:hypothetical protein